MNVYKLVGRNVEITDALRDYVSNRLKRLERFSSQVVDAKVALIVNAASDLTRRNRVEVQLNVPNGIIRAEEAAPDMYQAIDQAAEVLERQLKKFKERFTLRGERTSDVPAAGVGAPVVPNGEIEPFEPEIVRTKRFELRPMAAEDAALQMEALGHDFYMFTNAQTNLVNVIYKRRDGHYGLIEPRA
ncbi:MAG TPA: ribosome-associated translation inhibitor RaiA [Deinococcales bacterium]|nr:ribosome-associated translation inhibitor RaiA [Deinococcales bacterium]